MLTQSYTKMMKIPLVSGEIWERSGFNPSFYSTGRLKAISREALLTRNHEILNDSPTLNYLNPFTSLITSKIS